VSRLPHLWEVDSGPSESELAGAPDWLGAKARENGTPSTLAGVIPLGARHMTLGAEAARMRRRGFAENEIRAALLELNKRCQEPLDPADVEAIAAGVTGRYEPDPEKAIRTVPVAEPRPVDAVLATFRRWLHLPDPGVVYVVCAVVAANRITALDPTWLIVVGPAGCGKTETLSSAAQLGGVHVVGTLTEASLLSGTPRKDTAAGASGGLLREIGEHGIVVLKDFGSVLSLHREQRAAVLAALRELYDGSWTRLIGSEGGRRLHWEGRLGLLAGATSAIDKHHDVLAQLGERFLFYRVRVDDARAMAQTSLAHQGRERGMRRELAEAVSGLFAGLNLAEPPALEEADTERLVSLSELVSRGRSPVVRDGYSRELELVPDSEAPGRIVGALWRLLAGLRLIGVSDEEAWRLVVKTGLDSMPATRLRALELLLGREQATTTELATMLGLPNPTTHRTLVELAAHDVVARRSQGQGKPDLWRVKAWTRLRYAEATSSDMSEPSLSIDPEPTEEDFSEEVASDWAWR
jgi:hypothetical protein